MRTQWTGPVIAYVFGLLSIVIGGLGCWVGVLAAGIYFSQLWINPVHSGLGLLSIPLSAIETYSGFLLLINDRNAIKWSRVFVFSSFVMTVFNIMGDVLTGQWSHITAVFIGAVIALFYPALVYFLVLKSEPVKSFYNSQG